MSISRHQIERTVNGAGEQLRNYVGDAQHSAGGLADRGRYLSRKAKRRLQRGARHAGELAEDFGDRAVYGMRRAQRQVKRHPLATIGIAAAAIGAGFLVSHLLRQRDQRD